MGLVVGRRMASSRALLWATCSHPSCAFSIWERDKNRHGKIKSGEADPTAAGGDARLGPIAAAALPLSQAECASVGFP